jgi:hypothetical protein
VHGSRRDFLKRGMGPAAASLEQLVQPPKTDVWVQLTTGGQPYPPSFQTLFLEPMFYGFQIWPIDQPASFAALLPAVAPRPRDYTAAEVTKTTRGAVGGAPTLRQEPFDYPWEPSGGRPHPGYDVIVLNDQMEWPEATRTLVKEAVDLGRGFVLIHYALGDNQTWPWWFQEVTGGLLPLSEHDGLKKATVANGATLDIRPVGDHPITRNVGAFSLQNETAFKGVWHSPKITPLLETTSGVSDRTIAWVGVHDRARVVCIQPGLARETHRHPAYRMLLRNAILWAAGRLG